VLFWTGNNGLHFRGIVIPAQGGGGGNVFKGDSVTGAIATQESLAAVASGGSCSATALLKSFHATAVSFSLK
jgi:hypothetical protein